MDNKNPLLLLMLFCSIILTSCSSSEEIVPEPNAKTEAVSSKAESTPKKSIEKDILNLINDYRTSNGLSKLNELSIITSQTSSHTEYMISKNRASHDNFYQRRDYLVKNAKANRVGENVAYGYTNAKSVVKAWLKSEGHRKNIEGDFNHFDITAKQNKNGKWYYTNIFIKK